MDREEILQIVERRLRGSGTTYLVMMWACFAGALVGLFAIVVDNPILDHVGGIAFLAMGGIMTGFCYFLYLNQGRPSSHPVYRALKENPQDIVWIYITQVRQEVYGMSVPAFSTVCLGLVDGYVGQLPVLRSEQEFVIGLCAQMAPHATVGYSDELAVRFQNDPGSLRVVR